MECIEINVKLPEAELGINDDDHLMQLVELCIHQLHSKVRSGSEKPNSEVLNMNPTI